MIGLLSTIDELEGSLRTAGDDPIFIDDRPQRAKELLVGFSRYAQDAGSLSKELDNFLRRYRFEMDQTLDSFNEHLLSRCQQLLKVIADNHIQVKEGIDLKTGEMKFEKIPKFKVQ